MSNNFFDIINEKHAQLGSETSNPREDRIKNIEKKIMEIILLHSDDGISHNDLAKAMNMDRKNLRRYTKSLLEQKLIVRENRKHGKYYPSTRLHQRKDLTADLIVKLYMRNILIDSNFLVESPSYFKYHEESFRYVLEKDNSVNTALFNFSNKIGALVTYAIIESLNPENVIGQNMTNKKLINYNLERWLDDAISTLVTYVLPIFKNYIYDYLNCIIENAKRSRSAEFPYGDRIFIDYLLNSSYLLDKECIEELYSAFFNIYPNLEEPLQKIRTNVPTLLQKMKEDRKKLLEKIEKQKSCNHKFIKWHNSSTDKDVFKCDKCGKLK